ncbi:hypothetical protein RF11_13179 [Thelohanellus kitauei]|uniref:Uncharacterized protein n=1 Tax=Thelohanellus kitauei TaxID=669202 RepID=A0A0C2NAG5_THEKT|nr:hypothetical protein RF11_13179 [Thelohanellus kitauei]
MDMYSIKKRNGLGLLIGVVLSIKARIVCVDKKEHRHGPDLNQVNARRVLNQVKENAITSLLSTQQIVASDGININQSTASALPALSSMTRLVQRTRRDANTPLSSPNSLSSIALPLENTISHRGEQFLQYDSGEHENGILIFSTNNTLELLRSSDCWYCDATFKTAHHRFLNYTRDYFEDFYIGRILRLNTRRPPLFPHSLWNCYDATINNNGRTNNSVEGWHNGFARFINCHHPDIFKFLEFLKSSQNLNEVKITQLQSGMVVSVERNRYKDHNQRLANICNTYRRENIIGYLRNIAYNITI